MRYLGSLPKTDKKSREHQHVCQIESLAEAIFIASIYVSLEVMSKLCILRG